MENIMELASWLRLHGDTMDFLKTSLGFMIMGIGAWYGTGTDDLVIFYHCYNTSQRRWQNVVGLVVGVALVIGASLLISEMSQHWRHIQLIGVCAVAYIGIQTIKGGDPKNKKIKNEFIKSLWLYLINATDDLALNASLMSSGMGDAQRNWYMIGVFTGMITMILTVTWLHRQQLNIPEKPRGWILLGVSGYLLWDYLRPML